MSVRMSYPQGSPCWLELVTVDEPAARRFYGELFGWEFRADGDGTTALLGGRPVAGIGEQEAPPGTPGAWLTFLAADDLAGALRRVVDGGGTVLAGPLPGAGGARTAIAADPFGAVVGLWQAGSVPGAGLVGEPGAPAWHELASRDLDRAGDFYAAVLGSSWAPVLSATGGPAFRRVEAGGEAVAGALQMTPVWDADIGSHWMPYLGVADADATAARIVALGGTVSSPPRDAPLGRFLVAADPQGAVFSVLAVPGGDG